MPDWNKKLEMEFVICYSIWNTLHFTTGNIMTTVDLLSFRTLGRMPERTFPPVSFRLPAFCLISLCWSLCAPANGLAETPGHAFPALSGLSEKLETWFDKLSHKLGTDIQPDSKPDSGGGTPPDSRPEASPGSVPGSVPGFVTGSVTNAVSGSASDLAPDFKAGERNAAPRTFDPKDADLWEPLISRLAADGVDEAKARKAFAELGPRYTSLPMGRKILELYGLRYGGALQANNVNGEEEMPVESDFSPVPASLSLAGCRKLIKNNDKLFKGVQKRYGVPAHTLVALLLVETNLGNDLGSEPAFRSLASMALSTTPQHIAPHLKKLASKLNKDRRDFIQSSLNDKSNWAYGELKALIAYADETGFELMKIPGSMYGAIGICQFMPSNIKPYGIDGDGDGKINLFKLADAVHSAANYLKQHGWQHGMSPERQMAVLRAYNQDNIYACTVQAVSGHLALSDEFHKSPAILAANPLNLVRGAAVPGYQKKSKVLVPIKPIPGYNDILGINPAPSKIPKDMFKGIVIEK